MPYLQHRDTGAVTEYVAWDEVLSLDGRFWHACPICGLGVCSPITGPPMAHAQCLADAAPQAEQEEAV